jgi:hypothetical protein
MQTNDPQRGKWSDLQRNGDQPFNDPNDAVEHKRDEDAPQKNDSQKVSQIDVSENICQERRRQKNKADFGNRSDYSPTATVGFSSSG